MKAIILNSGLGSRMGDLTKSRPKCLVKISGDETILSRQLHQLSEQGIHDVIITTGAHELELKQYCQQLELPLNYIFVHNPRYQETNYIYSLACAERYLRDDDVLLLHGDLVFENEVLNRVMNAGFDCMVVNSAVPLPKKDFKAVVTAGKISAVGIEFFTDNAMAAQPLYRLSQAAWNIWLDHILTYCKAGHDKVYAEAALNEVTDKMNLMPLDVRHLLCSEIDTQEDLAVVSAQLSQLKNRTVYMCFATDILHGGHIAQIHRAKQYGKLIIGVLSDEAVAGYRRFPLLPLSERMKLFKSIVGVHQVVEQKSLSYADNLKKYQPDFVVHGDDWQTGIQKPIRDEVISILAEYGGRLLEFPYETAEKYQAIDQRVRAELSLPDLRRGRLKKLIQMKGLVNAIETHSGLTGLIAENVVVNQEGGTRQFDAMWISSLCDSTDKGKPDIELVDMTSRFRTIDDIMEVTTKPIIFDADTGGLKEHFVYTVRSLERIGVSMVIIEDKTGLKKNSLFGTEVQQTQDSIEHFSEKIAAGKAAQKSKDFMICARIESLILEQGMEDALARARAFVKAGADAIMIHSRKKDPTEIFTFVKQFREEDGDTPVVVVPTSFNSVTEEEFKACGVNVVIYANQLMRAGFPAMQKAAACILEHHRALECDALCMPFKEIIRLIPTED